MAQYRAVVPRASCDAAHIERPQELAHRAAGPSTRVRNTLHDIDLGLPLGGLVSVPYGHERQAHWPLLVFLHGANEAAPTPARVALTRHGPLRPHNNPIATSDFVIVAPQLPEAADAWQRHSAALALLLNEVESAWNIDPDRVYLTGFSFGANGVFDLALRRAYPWAALWAVDPTRLPAADPGLPIWLSLGQVSRALGRQYASRLRLSPPGATPGDRVYQDAGGDHVHTAALAYAEAHTYRWLLKHSRRATAVAAQTATRTNVR